MNVREEIEGWRGLMMHPKWKELQRIGEEQRALRLAGIIGGLDSVREEDKQRGEYLGIGLILSVPENAVEALEVELDNLKERE